MAVVYVWSGASGSNNGTNWANAYTSFTNGIDNSGSSGTVYVAHDHVETVASSAIGPSSSNAAPTKMICVNRAGSVPPVSADRRATAQITCTGNWNIGGYTHFDGIILIAGSGASTVHIQLCDGDGTSTRMDNCSLRLGATGAGRIKLGGGFASNATFCELNNTTLSFAAVGQMFEVTGVLKWRNTPSALLGTIPTTLFTSNNAVSGDLECIGVDLSAATSGKTLVGGSGASYNSKFRFIDCKLNASVTRAAVPTLRGTREVDFIRSGSAGTNYTIYAQRYAGSLIEETTIVRTGGATDGTTPIAWKIVTTANCSWSMPFECPPIAIWNDTSGSSRTATIEGIWGGGAVPNDNEIWLDVEYLSDAASPQGSFVNDGTADLLAAAAGQTSSSATWGGSTTKFKLNVSFTAQQKGWIYARVKCAKASSTFYIDPLVTLT